MPATPDFKTRLNQIARRNRNKTHLPGETWPMEKKLEVVATFLMVGNMRIVAASTGVPYDLVRKWKAQPWWKEYEAELRLTHNIQMDNKLSKIVEKSLDATLDRVENGDFFYDQKSGEVRRRPAPLRDIHRVAMDSISKQQLIRKEEHQDTSAKQTVEDHLKMLAHEMAKWNKAQEKKSEVIDLVEVEDAIYEEREAGLQEGTAMGAYEEAEPGEGSSGTECSPEDSGEVGPSSQG